MNTCGLYKREYANPVLPNAEFKISFKPFASVGFTCFIDSLYSRNLLYIVTKCSPNKRLRHWSVQIRLG